MRQIVKYLVLAIVAAGVLGLVVWLGQTNPSKTAENAQEKETVNTPNEKSEENTATSSSVNTAPNKAVLTSKTEVYVKPKLSLHVMGAEEQHQEGKLGSYCWPKKEGPDMCADGVFVALPETTPLSVSSTTPIRLSMEAFALPSKLSITVRGRESGEKVAEKTLDVRQTSSFTLNGVNPGMYLVQLGGVWSVGDAAYTFKVKVVE